MAGLIAVTRPIEPTIEIDLVAFASGRSDDGAGTDGVLFSRSGAGLAGQGAAWRGSVDDVGAFLRSIHCDDTVDRPGTGPVAFGALPFDSEAATDVVVPELVVGVGADGARWITRLSVDGRPPDIDAAVATGDLPPADQPPVDQRPADEPDHFTAAPSRPPAEWCDVVAEATARIRAGQLEKVVLAREIVVTANRPFVVGTILRRLRTSYPDCFVYGVDGYIGASPELLVGRDGDLVQAQPMAGTTARRGDPEADARAAAALLASPVYRHEHEVTIDMVHDTLLPFCSYLDDEPEPSVVALANVAHLATWVEGRLSHPPASVVELVRALHPTPAVCGRPRAVAAALIAELEGFDRGRYAGAVGWVDAAGNGQWAVALRGTQLDGTTARVFAGNGIVGDSDPATELAETRAKLQAVLGVLIRP